MSTSPEGAATIFKTWKSTFVGHLGLQSMSYRVGTPCRSKRKWYKAQKVQKYALNSQLQALQILTNNDEVEN